MTVTPRGIAPSGCSCRHGRNSRGRTGIADSIHLGTNLAGATAQCESEVVYRKIREARGVLFCDMDTTLREYPELVRWYVGKVVAPNDNKFSAFNSSAWSGDSPRTWASSRAR